MIYRRPGQIAKGNVFCSTACYRKLNSKKLKKCLECLEDFYPKHSVQRYCSKQCATVGVRKENPWSTRKNGKVYKNTTQMRLFLLEDLFQFKSCMVDTCNYSTIYEVHRLIPGKEGGEYVVGNMFAICPNHHAEVTRNVITLKKINDYTLTIVENNPIINMDSKPDGSAGRDC
jgi:hypothetical protein